MHLDLESWRFRDYCYFFSFHLFLGLGRFSKFLRHFYSSPLLQSALPLLGWRKQLQGRIARSPPSTVFNPSSPGTGFLLPRLHLHVHPGSLLCVLPRTFSQGFYLSGANAYVSTEDDELSITNVLAAIRGSWTFLLVVLLRSIIGVSSHDSSERSTISTSSWASAGRGG